ncbi:MAG: LD-carboxypeptidase [Ignavibacteriaceae bacterium]
MNRKKFLKNLALSSLAVSSFSYADYLNTYHNADKIIRPARLKKGDRLGLIAPGGFITKDELKTSVNNLEELGFKVAYTKNILSRNGYLAGTDEQRASDLNEMFSRNDIDGIVAARGGYGCTRILPLIDYNLIGKNPKVLLGYSDITALHMAIFSKTGLVSFHGPVGISTFNEYSISNLKNVLLYPLENLTLYNTENEKNSDSKSFTIISGKSSGRLVGGNLSLIVSLIGTPYDFDSTGKLIFIEEIGEQPYRIDRMLTQMIEAGKFENASGIILGEFIDCEPKKDDLNSFSLKEVLYKCLYNLNVPVIYGMSFGHIKNKLTLPIGINAELNSINQTITLLESAVK